MLPVTRQLTGACCPADVGKAPTGPPPPTVALLSKDGALAFVGQPRGLLTVVDASSLCILDVVKVLSRMLSFLSLWHWLIAFNGALSCSF